MIAKNTVVKVITKGDVNTVRYFTLRSKLKAHLKNIKNNFTSVKVKFEIIKVN